VRKVLEGNLQKRQSGNRENTTGIIDALQDCHARKAFDPGVVVWEIRDEQTNSDDAVVDKRTPWAPSPANLSIVMRPHLDVNEIWAEWYHESSD
jgi:hypothetical protein